MISEDTHFLSICLHSATTMLCAAISKDQKAYDGANNHFRQIMQIALDERTAKSELDSLK